MKKILLILLFAITSWAAQGVWTGATSDMNLASNWGLASIESTDTLTANSGSAAMTASANLACGKFVTTSGYSGNISFSGYTFTGNVGGIKLDHTGTSNLGNGITLNGNTDTLHVGSGVGTITASSCVVTMNGTTAMVIDIDKGIDNSYKSLTLGAGAVVTNSGAQSNLYVNSTYPLTIGTGASLIINRLMNICLTGSSTFALLGAGYSIGGSEKLYFSPKNSYSLAMTVPAITTNNVAISLFEYGNIIGSIYQLGGAINTGTKNFSALTYNANSTGTFNFNGQDVTCDTFKTGANAATNTVTLNYSTGDFLISAFNGSTYNAAGTTNENFQSSQWTCAGNWTYGSNHIVKADTSKVTFTNTATITTSGKRFHKVVFPIGKKITLAATSSGSFSGFPGFLDTIVSSSAGMKDTISLTSTQVDTFLYLKDQNVKTSILICTTGCVDGGGNSGNIVFSSTQHIASYPAKQYDTLGQAKSTSLLYPYTIDSVIFTGTFPEGISGTAATGLISGTPTVKTPQTIIKAVIWYGGLKQDSCYDTMTVVGIEDLFMGHSMMATYNLIQSPAYYFELNYGHRSWRNKAKGGETITGTESRVDSCLEAYAPNKYYLWIGYNEFMSKPDSASCETRYLTYIVEWKSIISKVKAIGATPYIVELTFHTQSTTGLKNFCRLFNQRIKDSCKTNGCYFVEILEQALKPGTTDTINTLYAIDSCHLNSTTAGAQFCADRINSAYLPGGNTALRFWRYFKRSRLGYWFGL